MRYGIAAAIGLAAAVGAWLGTGPGAPARAESPVEPKPFTEKIPGSDVTFDMVPVPAGTLKIGSPPSEKNRKADEGPQVDVQMEPFFIGKYEVTQAEYGLFLLNYNRLAGGGAKPQIPADRQADAVSYPTPIYEVEAGPILQRMGRGGKFPAVIMSYVSAKQYTKWLSKRTGRFYRLPTEAEWEYACRAGKTTAYPFGDDPAKLGDYAWFSDNSILGKGGEPAYRQVGLKKPNEWGLYDMLGNVAEFCIDQYDADWYKQFAGKKVTSREFINWPHSPTQHPRCIRGGSFNSFPEECRSAARRGSDKELNTKDPQIPKSPYWLTEGFDLGFRLVCPVKEPTEAEKHKFWDIDDPGTLEIIKGRGDKEVKELVEPPK